MTVSEQEHGETMRLARYMAAAGVASRRHCEELIEAGYVTVNGAPVMTPACVVTPGKDTVCCQGRELTLESNVYLMLNKPVGYTCSVSDAHAEKVVYDLLPKSVGRVFSVGRLDRDSEGLLLFTNDGEFSQLLTHPSHQVLKTYVVDCDGDLSEAGRRRMLTGIRDDGEELRARSVRIMRSKPGQVMLEVVLGEGRKREVRRMCAQVGLNVVRLARVSFGGLELGNLVTGAYRSLSKEEVTMLKQSAAERTTR